MDAAPEAIPQAEAAEAPREAPPVVGGVSLRLQIGFTLCAILALSVAVILAALGYLRDQVFAILPEVLVFEADTAFREVLFGQAAIMLVASVVLLFVAFVAIDALVTKPLRRITDALDAYARDGARIPLPDGASGPREIRSLQLSVASLIERADSVHKRDVDVSRMKSDFISTAAHQFRTPLTGIRWALEALEKEPLTEEQMALVKSALGKSRDLVGIVGTLLDISSIESGKYRYKFAPTDLAELAAEVARDFVTMAAARQVAVMFQGAEERPPMARADRERVKWVVNNLVENAIRYTPSGGTVRISAEAGSGRVFLRVKDTGIGIPESDRGNIFERFYRAGNAVQKENAGSGLGLYIARTIAKDHGGELSFEPNRDGPGTTFVLSVPVA